jgi:hypothetical protein
LVLEDGYARVIERGLVTPAEAAVVADFHNRAKDYRVDGSAEDVLRDPQWIALTNAARSAWRALAERLANTEDGDAMRSLEETWGL